ncbi:MAG: mandelate racemase/muconate lactonizing enzyme family protein, partial [Coriobacteriia bacterium]|nr:mandelate racemase/muconate lactonizing enzyme family protein [Coriobacteriia bacterium]
MKIVDVEAFVFDAGWQSWTFVKVSTDEGITGWGECSVPRGPFAVAGAVEDIKNILVGTDPRAYEMRFADMARLNIQGPLG